MRFGRVSGKCRPSMSIRFFGRGLCWWSDLQPRFRYPKKNNKIIFFTLSLGPKLSTMNNHTAFFAQIRDLIARNEMDTALQRLRALLDNSPKLDEILLQSARFQGIRKQIRLGLVSHAEANLTQNQIRAGLVDLLSEMEENIGRASNPSDVENTALRAELERAISIVHSKNVVIGSTISAGGNVTIGDNNQINWPHA
jgi:Effector-associated domain 11